MHYERGEINKKPLLNRILLIERNELKAVVLSFFYFFSLLCAYYILRPVRDEMGIISGVENLQWLFTATFVTMLAAVPLFGYVTRKFSRSQFVPLVYYFFVANLLLFFVLLKIQLEPKIIGGIFFVWLSVFNLFAVSVFWSLMADIFTTGQSKRVFGIIAAGGSAGAISGPAITTFLAKPLGPVNLILISAVLLLCSSVFVKLLIKWYERNIGRQNEENIDQPIGGNIFAGITAVLKSKHLMKIAVLIVLYTTVSTFLYFEQAHIFENEIRSSTERTSMFGLVDLSTNTLAVGWQFFITSRVIKRLGLSFLLAVIPFLVMLAFLLLSFNTTVAVIVAAQVIHRSGNFSFQRPGREILFTMVSREARYKAKNFIDTVIYRGSDAVAGWLFALLTSLQLTLSSLAVVAVQVAFLWMLTGYNLGKSKPRNEQ